MGWYSEVFSKQVFHFSKSNGPGLISSLKHELLLLLPVTFALVLEEVLFILLSGGDLDKLWQRNDWFKVRIVLIIFDMTVVVVLKGTIQ